MALLEPPLEPPLAPWVTAVVAVSPDLAGHPVEAKAAAAIIAAAAVTLPKEGTPPPTVDELPAARDPSATAPRGVLTKAVDLMRLLPALARLRGTAERLVLRGMPRDANGVTLTVRAALGGHLPPVLVPGVLPTGELRRAVAAAYVDHFGSCKSSRGGTSTGGGAEGGGGRVGGGGHGRYRRHWPQAERVGLLARFAATAGNAALAAEAAALASRLGLPEAAARAAAVPPAGDVAGRIMDAAAARTVGGLGPDMAAVVSSGLPAAAVVEAIGLAGFIGYLQRLWVVFLRAW
eukprot:TRINITY_DN2910_c0_g1_i2.p1 TRINITY_DN2910_c0_g1~~TRINITY_DN2910_c0_g1_i2.p1  ORF type:complete len:291 (+),score=71.80 TRINITY_DN2910_c0_g1_i2:977-1849(+)